MPIKLKLVDWEKYRKQTGDEVILLSAHIRHRTCDHADKTKALALVGELLSLINKLDFNLCKSEYIKGYGPGGKKGPGPYNG